MMKYSMILLALFGALISGVVCPPTSVDVGSNQQNISVGEEWATENDQDDIGDGYSQAFFPDNDGETANMPENLRPLFDNFCVESRDEIRSYLATHVSEQSQKVFNILMNRVHEIVQELLTAKLEAWKSCPVSDASKEIFGQNGQDQQSGLTQQDIENKIAENLTPEGEQNGEEGDDTPRGPNVFQRIASGIVDAIQYVAKMMYGEASKAVAELKQEIGPADVTDAITNACNEVNFNLVRQIDGMYKSKKSELEKSAKKSNQQELVQILQGSSMTDLKCATAGKMVAVFNVCEYVQNCAGLFKMAVANMQG